MAETSVSLARQDIPPIEYPGTVKETDPQKYTEMSPELKRWLANFVDVFNDNMQNIEAAVKALSDRLTAIGG